LIDFIKELLISKGITYLIVVTNRLSKSTIFVPLPNIRIETVVQAFIKYVVAYY
jgi:hypothetical protein